MNMADPAMRNEVAGRMRAISEQRRLNARARAVARGLPLRITRPNGVTQEIAAFDGETPVYFTTHNSNTAISTGANRVRIDYGIDGSGITIGMWDGGSGRPTHQEFGARMVVMDGAASIDHATHVGGTLAAAGTVASAMGMAPAMVVDSYDWNSDVSEMTSRAATGPGQAGKLYLSNHSYGYVSGWNYVNNGTRVWEWYGNGTTTTSIEQDFGRYNQYARDQDSLSFNAPYYLIFRSAGNERTNNPSVGQNVALSAGSSTVVEYDPTLHPAGDGTYRGGFETVTFDALAKNVMTVGSVTDAVTGGSRDPSKANSSNFSSWGPTDDGRIKPDVVANGDGVYSTLAGSNTSYGTYSGTSMSSPNAAGSAALLIQHYGNLFPGQAMRASTLKSLLIHTADDRGNPGPDYKFGWGLINAKAAADLLSDHHDYPEKQRLTEDQLSTSTASRTHAFVWDGASPIRATLGWTDPAGTATSTSDLRNPRLVNDLNLKIIAPGGEEYFPFVMPFVGTWTQASMDSAAITGVNTTDNLEQVVISGPPALGTYQMVVSFSGTLTNNSQKYSLLLSGSTDDEPPPLPLTVTAVTPDTGLPGTVVMDLAGSGFLNETAVKLSRTGYPDIAASNVQLIDGILRCEIDLAGTAPGKSDVVATNPDNETFTLAGAFTVLGALWSENFDGTWTGWMSNASLGSNDWAPTEAKSHSPARSYYAAAPASKTTTHLISPSISIPANGNNLQLKFWHDYNLQSGQDGGRLEFSIDGGSWIDIESSGSGAVFASNGYNTTISGGGPPQNRSEFTGQRAWSGNSGGFIETIVNLTDSARFAGKSLRVRWSLATNSSTASHGWYVDSIALAGGGDLANEAPVVTSAATTSSEETVTDTDGAVFQVIRGASAAVSVGATDDGGEADLHYTWAVVTGNPVYFSPNDNNAAKSATADFEAIGDYQITVSIRDLQGLTTNSSLNVRVVQTASDLAVSPATASLPVEATQGFSATLLDQFGGEMTIDTSSLTWSASGGGAIDSTGLFVATDAGGPFVITASENGFSSTAAVTVTPAQATVVLGDLIQTYDGTPRAVGVTTSPAGLETIITYEGSMEVPIHAGRYAVEVNITDPNYQGGVSGGLVISKAEATLVLGDLAADYDGTAKSATAVTTPAGLAVDLTYDGSSDPPSDAGTYEVLATISDPNHEGGVSGELVISKSAAMLVLGDLAADYDGTPKSATAVTTPAGLAVDITYDGSSDPPTGAGTYEVVAIISDPNHEGGVSGELVISKAAATLVLGDLAADYDGTAKSATAVTTPAGLAVDITYDGSSDPPTGAGTYEVVATISDPDHEGSVSGELVITEMTYALWIESQFSAAAIKSGAAGPDQDHDRDGSSNLAEYALGTDPFAFTPPLAFRLDSDFLTLSFMRPKHRSDVGYQAESSDRLGLWLAAPLEVIGENGDWESLRVRVLRTDSPDQLFLRLRFELLEDAENR